MNCLSLRKDGQVEDKRRTLKVDSNKKQHLFEHEDIQLLKVLKRLKILICLLTFLFTVPLLNGLTGEGLQEEPDAAVQSQTPVKNEEITPKNVDLIFLIDRSDSMNDRDPTNQRIDSIISSIELLKKYSSEHIDHRVGIVFFGTEAELLLPLTSVKEIDEKEIRTLSYTKGTTYTSFISAFETAYEEFKNKNVFVCDHNSQVLLITDGIFTGSTKEFTKYEGDNSKIDNLRKSLIYKIGGLITKLKEKFCTISILVVRGDEDDKNSWKDFAFSPDGAFYSFKELGNEKKIEHKCQRVLSRVLNLYSLRLHSPKSIQLGKRPIFIKADFIRQNSIVRDSSIILRVEITRPLKKTDSLNITSNTEGLYISEYLENPEVGEYSMVFKVYDGDNILTKFNRKFRVNKKKAGWVEKTIIILIILVFLLIVSLVLLVIYLRKIRKRQLKKDVFEEYFKLYEDYLNEHVEDKEGTKKKLKEIANTVAKTGRAGSTSICLAFRNFYLQENKEGEIKEIKKLLEESPLFKQGIGYGISFNLLLMLLQSNEKYLFIRLYEYLKSGVDLEVLHHAKEFLSSSDIDRIVSISRRILDKKGILKNIDDETLNLKKEKIKDLCDVFCNLFDINKANIGDKLRDVVKKLKMMEQNILFKNFIIEVFESIYNSLEPKFWEGYFPFAISKSLTIDKIVDIEERLPEHLICIADALVALKNLPVFPIEEFKKSIKTLKDANETAILPEKNVVDILINKWEKAIEGTFILSDGQFDKELKPIIKICLITKKIPINSSYYERRYNKRNPVYFELTNEGKGIVRNLRISIFFSDIDSKNLLGEIKVSNIEQLTRLYEGLIYNFDAGKINSKEKQRMNLFFKVDYDDIQKANNTLTFQENMEFFKIEPFQELDNPFKIERGNDTIEEIKSILTENKMEQVINLWGQPKIGKTSILQKLKKMIGPKYISVYTNFQEDNAGADFKSFCSELKKNILFSIKGKQASLDNDLINKKSNFEEDTIESIKSIISILAKNLKIILILDDFELYFSKINNDRDRSEIVSGLEDVIKSSDKVVLILSGTHCFDEYNLYPKMKHLRSFYDRGPIEILLNLLCFENLKKRLLRDDLYYHFNELALRKIIKVTNGNPYYLTILFNKMIGFRNKDKLVYMTKSEANKLINYEIENNGIDAFWKGLFYNEKLIIMALNKVARWEQSATLSEIALSLKQYSDSLELEFEKSDIQNLLNIVEHMVKKEILNKKYGRYSINIELLSKKIKKHKDEFEKTLKR